MVPLAGERTRDGWWWRRYVGYLFACVLLTNYGRESLKRRRYVRATIVATVFSYRTLIAYRGEFETQIMLLQIMQRSNTASV